MKITKQMENKIRRCARLNYEANILSEEIRLFLFENKLNLNDMLIDSCQIENKPEEFIKFLNGEADEYGNKIEDFILDNNVDFEDFY